MNSQEKLIIALSFLLFSICIIIKTPKLKIQTDFNTDPAKKVVQAYKEINNALYKAQEKYGDFNQWSSSLSSDKEKLETFMHHINIEKKKDCGINDTTGNCWWSLSLINHTKHGKDKFAHDYYTFIDKHNNAVYLYHNYYWGFLMVYDINGKDKGPNERGKDIFYFQTGPDNVEFVPGGEDQLASNSRLKYGCFKNGCCAAWVVRTGNMDYLKADLNGVCPNGKKLSWFNTTCKK